MPFQAGSETVDQDTGRPEAGQLDDRRGPELDQRTERHQFKVQSSRGDVLTEVSRCNCEASFPEVRQSLQCDQVDLPQIGKPGATTGEVSVPDKRTGVGVTFDTMAFHQNDLIPWRLAEVVPAIGSHRNHPSLKRKVVRVRHQAARASERRFWRR
ncbi:hypothetical protein GGD64_008250 [Bradyrhizobium sp. CIR3A]|nr:hypothetical protein [Bradyrhizobium sp. CIR3A]